MSERHDNATDTILDLANSDTVADLIQSQVPSMRTTWPEIGTFGVRPCNGHIHITAHDANDPDIAHSLILTEETMLPGTDTLERVAATVEHVSKAASAVFN